MKRNVKKESGEKIKKREKERVGETKIRESSMIQCQTAKKEAASRSVFLSLFCSELEKFTCLFLGKRRKKKRTKKRKRERKNKVRNFFKRMFAETKLVLELFLFFMFSFFDHQ